MKEARLIYAASERDATLFYLTNFFAPDPFIWWEVDGKSHAMFHALEIDRARATASIDHIYAQESFQVKGEDPKEPATLIEGMMRKQGIDGLEVPRDFPLGLARELEEKGLKVRPCREEALVSREIKTANEVEKITAAIRLAEKGMARGIEVIRASEIDGEGLLWWEGKPLSSERVRGEMEAKVVRLGGLPSNTIVAGGEQACDPHERGSGPLYGHVPIILDIFPRDQKTGYYGDLTRTVVRGKATQEAKRLYETVAEGQQWAMGRMKEGACGKELHKELVERFKKAGYPTEQRKGRWVGFFHGTGHSLGLELHEAPRLQQCRFCAGHVFTVEPGLYYPGIGGVRVEDVVVVTPTGIRNLTQIPQEFELL